MFVSKIESRVHRLQSDLKGQRHATYGLNKKLEASTEATQNLSSLLQGVLDLQNVSKATPEISATLFTDYLL